MFVGGLPVISSLYDLVWLLDLSASLSGEGFARQIADEAIDARISPCPAKTVVEEKEWLSSLELEHRLGAGRWACAENRRGAEAPLDGLGIMRGDHLIGESRVG